MDGSPGLGLSGRDLSPVGARLPAAGPAGVNASGRVAAYLCVSLGPVGKIRVKSAHSAQRDSLYGVHSMSRVPPFQRSTAWQRLGLGLSTKI